MDPRHAHITFALHIRVLKHTPYTWVQATAHYIPFLPSPSIIFSVLYDRRPVNRALEGGALEDLAGAAALGPHVSVARGAVLSCVMLCVMDGA